MASLDEHPDRLPDPSAQQVSLALEAARRALDGEEVRMYRNNDGRLVVQYVHKSAPESAS
jgi:hypothetical protein